MRREGGNHYCCFGAIAEADEVDRADAQRLDKRDDITRVTLIKVCTKDPIRWCAGSIATQVEPIDVHVWGEECQFCAEMGVCGAGESMQKDHRFCGW
jgi:hypothetical protein